MNQQHQALEAAIAELESQRALLGHAVVTTTIAALRERQQLLQKSPDQQPITTQRKQVTVLFAKVSGLNRATQEMADTDMLDLMNVLWYRLDLAITEQGGVIDKHMGDEVLGLFGVPVASEDDPENAIRAALTMRATLRDFVNELSTLRHPNGQPYSTFLQEIQIGIGINTGPVLLSPVGSQSNMTVIGDTVNTASRLQQAAPPDGILVSQETVRLTGDQFKLEEIAPVSVKGKQEPVPVSLVSGVRPRTFQPSRRGIEGVQTRMMGRDEQLARLQQGVQRLQETGRGCVITIIGDAGVGKSRLLHEFNQWVYEHAPEAVQFKGRADQQLRRLPYSLIRDVLTSYFGVQDNDAPSVVEEKLLLGIARFSQENEATLRQRIRLIGNMLGFDLSDRLIFQERTQEFPQMREQAFEYIIDFFKSVTAVSPTPMILLEDVHWADDGSLELITRLVEAVQNMPMLMVLLTRPTLMDYARHWEETATAQPDSSCYQQMELTPLSENDSHQMVQNILQKATDVPADISQLIVQSAEGNPFYVEELIKVLIEDRVIVTGKEAWDIRPKRLTHVRIPSTLTAVLQSRLDRLSTLERVTLQRASVMGRMFWEAGIVEMNRLADDPIPPEQTDAALKALEERELIFKQKMSVFAGTSSYIFKHAISREVTYESVLLRDRPLYHRRVADWLVEQSGDRVSEYAGSIAEHYELANEDVLAAELYELAARRADDTFNIPMAIGYYHKAMSLISHQSHQAEWQLQLQERLGALLYQQARLIDAAQVYMAMEYTAELDGDLAAQAKAWNGLARIYQQQANFTEMERSAEAARHAAWLVGDSLGQIDALLLKGDALNQQNAPEMALKPAEQALSLSSRYDLARQLTESLGLLCGIYVKLGQPERANSCLEQLEAQAALFEGDSSMKRVAAYSKMLLGEWHGRFEQFDRAAYYLLSALKLYRELNVPAGVAVTLNELGETARIRGNPKAAVSLLEEAIEITQTIGDQFGTIRFRLNLAKSLVRLGESRRARDHLKAILTLVVDQAAINHWVGLPDTYRFLAEAMLDEEKPSVALELAQMACEKAIGIGMPKQMGTTWRVLAQVLAAVGEAAQVIMDGQPYGATDAFAESQRLLKQAADNSVGVYRQQAQTLAAWGAYEQAGGDAQKGQQMIQEAQAIAEGLDIVLV